MPTDSSSMDDPLFPAIIVGDLVVIASGTFESHEGRVITINLFEGVAEVGIQIFGRDTLVEIELGLLDKKRS